MPSFCDFNTGIFCSSDLKNAASVCVRTNRETWDLVTHTHPFNGPLSGTTQVSQYQKGKTNLDFTEARDSGWQWQQLGQNASLHLAPDRQPHQHPTTLMFFTGRMPFLPPNQQRQSTEGKNMGFSKISKNSSNFVQLPTHSLISENN